MTETEWILLGVALACVLVAGLVTTIETALQSFSKSRAEGHVKEGTRNAERLLQVMQDPAPFLNTALCLRMVFEVAAIVLVGVVNFLITRSIASSASGKAGR